MHTYTLLQDDDEIDLSNVAGHGHDNYIYAEGLRDFEKEFADGKLKDKEVVGHVKSVIAQNLPYKEKFTKTIKIPQGMKAVMAGGQHLVLAKILRQMAIAGGDDRLVREVARAIVKAYHVPSKDFVNEAGAIQNFIQRYFRYAFDFGEQFTFAHRALIDWYQGKEGLDCDCMAILFTSLMLSMGWRKVWIVLVDSRGDGVLSHACAAIQMPRQNTVFGDKIVNVELTRKTVLGWMPQAPKYTKYLKVNVVRRD